MPQMAPMNWMTLFIFFTMMFMMFNSLNFFIFSYNITPKTLLMNKNKMNFKW